MQLTDQQILAASRKHLSQLHVTHWGQSYTIKPEDSDSAAKAALYLARQVRAVLDEVEQ